MFAHCAVGTTSLPKATSLGEADITCTQGQTSFGDLLYRRSPLVSPLILSRLSLKNSAILFTFGFFCGIINRKGYFYHGREDFEVNMRKYLSCFFSEFGFEARDAEKFLSVYDTIISSKEANGLLSEALAAYENDININQITEIIVRARRISDIIDVHPYTVDLLVYLCMTRHFREVCIEKGVDLQIYRDSVLDLKWKLDECKAVKGICGSFVAEWFPDFFNLKRVALGRLQFEVIVADFDYDKNGITVEKGKTKLVNVHIPRTGTPLDKESCDSAYAMAREYFKEQVGEPCILTCHSWLLFPQNKEILPPHLNTYRFMSEYDVVKWGYNKGESLWRLFDTDEQNPERLPSDGSFRRSYREHLMNGGRVGWGLGVKL